jgi:hypothetical protein
MLGVDNGDVDNGSGVGDVCGEHLPARHSSLAGGAVASIRDVRGARTVVACPNLAAPLLLINLSLGILFSLLIGKS